MRPIKPGDIVVLGALPPSFYNDLPASDQRAISEVVGKRVRFNGFDDAGRYELEFTDSDGMTHVIYVGREFIKR